jgi:hypothetical protein
MKYSDIDWDSILIYAQDIYQGCSNYILKPLRILQLIEEGFEKSRELSDLNLPIYLIYPPEDGEKELYPKTIELHLPVGSPVYVPVKEVISIGGIAPCNLALAVMDNAVKAANKQDESVDWVNLIEIRTRSAGSYYVLLTRTVYEELMTFWHSTL